jgi:hypothetical protein
MKAVKIILVVFWGLAALLSSAVFLHYLFEFSKVLGSLFVCLASLLCFYLEMKSHLDKPTPKEEKKKNVVDLRAYK